MSIPTMLRRTLLAFTLLILTGLVAQAQLSTTIETASPLPPDHNHGPIYRSSSGSSYDYCRYSYLYTQSELAAAGITPGTIITGVGWFKENAESTVAGATAEFRIYMKTSAATDYTTNADWSTEVINGSSLVYENTAQTIPATVGYIDFTLDNQFVYTGGSIEIATDWDISGVSGSPTTGSFDWRHGTVVDKILGQADSGPVTNLSTTTSSISSIDDERPDIQFSYLAGGDDNATVSSIITPAPACPGQGTVSAVIANVGGNAIDSVNIGWTFDGSAQADTFYIDTLGLGESDTVELGTVSISGTHDIEVYTFDPNGVTDSDLTNDTLNTTFKVGLTGVYTIGGASPDYNTFTDAASDLNTFGICGPVVFNVRPGTYTEQFTLNEITGSGSTNTITFQSENGDSTSVVLEFPVSSTTTDNYVVNLNGTDHTIFNQLTVQRTGTEDDGANVFALNSGADNNVITNCQIVGPTTTDSDFDGSQSGIFSDDASADNNNTFSNNWFKGNANGIWFNGDEFNNAVGNTAVNNVFETFYLGVFFLYQDTLTVSDNIIEKDNPADDTEDYFGISLRYCGTGINVFNNRISTLNGDDTYAIRLRECFGTAASPINIYNNFAQAGGVSDVVGISLEDGNSDVNVIYNSTNVTGTSTTLGKALNIDDALTSALQIANNSFVNMGGGYAYYIDGATLGVDTSDYNNLYTTGSTVGYWDADAADLAAFQTASGQEANSVSADPLYTSTTDLHANAPELNNVGLPIPQITEDIDGEARDGLTPDIGADEYSVPSDDAGISAVLVPSQLCPGTSDVQVTLVNFGLSNLTSAMANWTVNGNAQTPLAYTGNLAPGEDTTFTIGSFNFMANNSYTITAFSTMPNGVTDTKGVNDTSSIGPLATGMSGNYTIDAGTAPSATNYQSFTDAVADLDSRGVCGAVVFDVTAASGPYTEQVVMNEINGASATNTITFNGNSNMLMYEGTSGGPATWLLDGTDHVTIDNLTIVCTDPTYGYGVLFTENADSNRITNCRISVDSVTSTTSSNSGGIVFSGSTTSNATDGDNGSYNLIQGNEISGGVYGVHVNGSVSGGSFDNVIDSNTIRDFYEYGVYMDDANGTVVSRNDIHRENREDVDNYYGVYITGGNPNTRVFSNKLHDTHTSATDLSSLTYGIYSSSDDVDPGEEAIIYNNLLYEMNGNNSMYGLYNSSSDGFYYYHNTVVLDDTSAQTTGVTRGIYQTTTADNLEYINNIVFIERGGTGTKHCIYLNTTSSTITADNNVYFLGPNIGGLSNFIGEWDNTDFADITTWQTANGGAFDQNSFEIDPEFTDQANNNFIPTSGTVDNSGQPVGITSDIDGNSRDANFPDPGAYEYVVPGLDAGISWVAPVSPTTGGSQTVTVNIANTKTQTINSVKVSYTDGTTTDSETFTGLNLTQGNTTDLSFTAPYNLSGFVTFTAWIDSVNNSVDDDQTNDTTMVDVCTALAGTYTIDSSQATSGTNFINFTEAVDALNLCGISAPVTFNVVAGSGPYNEQIIIGAIAGASATNTVTFNGNLDTLQFEATSSDRHIVRLDGAKHVTIDSLVIRSTDATYGWGVHFINDADSNTVSNSIIDINSTSTTASNTGGIVASGSTSSLSTDGDNGSNLTLVNNTIINGYYSIRLNGDPSSFTTNNVIQNNTLLDWYRYGIYLNEAESNLVQSNDMSRPQRSSVSDFTGVYVLDGNGGHNITQNSFHNPQTGASSASDDFDGILITNQDATATTWVTNNIFYNIDNSDDATMVELDDADNVNIYHNTYVVDDAEAATSSFSDLVYGLYLDDDNFNIDFQNNSMYLRKPGDQEAYVFYVENAASTFTSDYNIVFIDTADYNVGYIDGTDYQLLADWQAGSGQDANSVYLNPDFKDAPNGDLEPLNPSADNLGTPIAGVTIDYFGDPRDPSTPDIGAIEFTPATDDIAVNNIIEPATTLCGSTDIDVTVAIENFGLDTAFTIPFTVVISGDTNATFSGTYSDTLLSQGTTTFTIGSFDFVGGGMIDITAYSELPGDADFSNDTTSITVDVSGLPTAPNAIAVTDTVCNGGSATLAVTDTGGTYTWFDAATGGNQLANSDTLVTGPLTSDTTFWVSTQGAQVYSIPPMDITLGVPNSGGGPFSTYDFQGLLFETFTTVTIDSVTVYPYSAGDVEFRVFDNLNSGTTGNTIASTVVTVSGANLNGTTPVTIPVDITLPPGQYRADAGTNTTVSDLYRNNDGAVYPYEEPGVLSIYNNTFAIQSPGTGDDYYYYFYDWQVTATGCPSPRTAVNVDVLENIQPAFAGFSTIENGLTVDFIADSNVAGNNYQFDFGDGNGGNFASVNHTYQNDGEYTVCLTVDNACSMDQQCDTIEVCAPLDADTILANANGLDAALDLGAASTGTPTSYQWYIDGALDSVTTTAPYNYTFAAEGNYDISVKVTNLCGETDSVGANVDVCIGLAGGIAADFADTTNLGFDFAAVVDSGTVTDYSWDLGDGSGTSTDSSFSYNYTNPGSYNVELTVTNACGETETYLFTANACAALSAGFTADTTELTADFTSTVSGSDVSYSWDFGDGTGTSTDANPSYTYDSSGTYTVELTVTDACGNTLTVVDDVTIDFTIGILENNAGALNVSLFPNPNEGRFNAIVEVSEASDIQFRVVDLLGREVYRTPVYEDVTGTHTERFNLMDRASGMYLVEVLVNDQKSISRIVVE